MMTARPENAAPNGGIDASPVAANKVGPRAVEEPREIKPEADSISNHRTEVTSSNTKRLSQRAKTPPSAFFTLGIILLLQFFGGVHNARNTFTSLQSSVLTNFGAGSDLLSHLRDLCRSLVDGDIREPHEYAYAAAWTLMLMCIGYILVYSPLRAGMWTGKRAKRHLVHRYMGLLFLAQYTLSWIEFLTNYEAAKTSYLPHAVALNGMIQGWSAYFSFKVLPELDDAGYYSDKAVLSRNFVHENTFFQLMVVYGSLYYNDSVRANLHSSAPGRLLEMIFVFLPYIIVRPWFPITRFKNAGTSMAGRTKQNANFYSIGVHMIKLFYLWAKYFLGFYMNFLVFLGLATDDNMKFIRGLFLLNTGTVSISIFLHTLRFKKVLPPRLTFSLYLLQIYATFAAIPYAYDLFIPHARLCGLIILGILCNMTRSRKIHAVWCSSCIYLLIFTDIDW